MGKKSDTGHTNFQALFRKRAREARAGNAPTGKGGSGDTSGTASVIPLVAPTSAPGLGATVHEALSGEAGQPRTVLAAGVVELVPRRAPPKLTVVGAPQQGSSGGRPVEPLEGAVISTRSTKPFKGTSIAPMSTMKTPHGVVLRPVEDHSGLSFAGAARWPEKEEFDLAIPARFFIVICTDRRCRSFGIKIHVATILDKKQSKC